MARLATVDAKVMRRGGTSATLERMAAADDLIAWNSVAEAYAATVGHGSDPIYRRFRDFLWRHLGDDLTGVDVLDLGCGHGWLAELCRTRGAAAVGVDGSDGLLDIARAQFPDVEFERADLSTPLPRSITSRTFDRVIAHMVVMDIPSLDSLAAALSECLADDGVVVVTLPHPSFFNQSPTEDADGDRYRRVKGYLEHEEWWISTFGGHRHYHRPLEFYVQWLASAGLGVVDLVEPPVPVLKPELERNDFDRWFTNIPTMLGMAARRVQTT
jgi:SAM-dependent methyltransferase